MTTADNRPFIETAEDDRLMTDADREVLGPVGLETSAGLTTGTPTGERGYPSGEPLVAQDVADDFRTRWEAIQQGFVDDPRNAVTEADKLVDDLLKRLSESFEQQHHGLEKQWTDGEPSTEDLRRALQRYRAFFQRLLAV